MISSIVHHPLFGRGHVLELRNAAREAVVRFDSGIRTVVQTNMLKEISEAGRPYSAIEKSAVRSPQSAIREATLTPEQIDKLEARRTIEALRYGVVPSRRIRDLSVGLERERDSLQRALAEVERTGGDVRVVLGEYGTGKSHFFELAAQEALERNFLVATTSLDIREVPPNRPQRIYNALIRALRYPDAPDTGTLVPLLDRLVNQPNVYAALLERLRETIFATALYNYSLMRQQPDEKLDLLLDWMSGEKVFIKAVRESLVAKSKEFPIRALSAMTTSTDQYCYLLNVWGWLATQAGYAGLALFIDESEHYSLLNQRGQERADNFFKGMIYTAMGSRPDARVQESDLQHQHNEHSFRLMERSELLVLFAVTPSANSFDYRQWLNKDQVVALQGHLPATALDELMARLATLHQQAYTYERRDEHIEIAQGLRDCLESKLINLRQMIRLATEIYDLCYAHPDFSPSQAVAELRHNLLGR